MEIPPLPEGCPWSGWTLPNIKWCEENLCAWITTPANTWSNLGYILIGLLMWWQLRRHADPVLRLFGPIAIVVGLFSGIYHASYTFFFQFFDFVAMFLFAFLPIVMNFRRLGTIAANRQLRWYGLGVAVLSALVPVCFAIGFPFQLLIASLICLIIGSEIAIRTRRIASPPLLLFAAALAALGGGATLSFLDVSGIWCDPTNHVVQGHALWHLLTAIALWVLSIYYGRAETS